VILFWEESREKFQAGITARVVGSINQCYGSPERGRHRNKSGTDTALINWNWNESGPHTAVEHDWNRNEPGADTATGEWNWNESGPHTATGEWNWNEPGAHTAVELIGFRRQI